VEFEQVQTLIDHRDESHTSCQHMEQSDATTRDGVCFAGEFVVNVSGSEPRLKCNSIA